MRIARLIAPLGVAAVTAAALTGTVLHAPGASAAVTLTVAADGSGQYRTVQAAIDAAPANSATTVTIAIKAGTYRGTVTVPATKPRLALVGASTDASRTVLVESHAAGQTKPGGGTWGTFGSATVTVRADDTLVKNLTMSNDFDEAAASLSAEQAVAAANFGDRTVFENVRLLGNQDTLLAHTPNTGAKRRLYVLRSYVEGDVDFIFGSGTVVFQQCTIHSLNRGSGSNNGYVTAAATDIGNRHGFLFWQSTLTSTAPARSVYLGRPWHPSSDPNARGQVVFRDSTLGAHIRTDPWTDMSGFSWRDARFAEYRNTGAGAAVNGNRPQLSAADAAALTAEAYLLGTDGWRPLR